MPSSILNIQNTYIMLLYVEMSGAQEVYHLLEEDYEL